MANNKQIAADVLQAVGGTANVTSVAHCMTRLRFNLKDTSLADEAVIKKIPGVIGMVEAGGQTQIIVGQNVPKVYEELCKLGGFKSEAAIQENLDSKSKEKLTPKKIGGNILNYMAGSLTPLIPVMLAAGMFKTVLVVCGPSLLNWIAADSNLYILLDFVYDAGFYFMPIYVGYTAAKKLGLTPLMGMFMGGILIAPDFVNLVSAGSTFSVFGLPVRMTNYAQSILPILLCVFGMSYIEKFFKKVVPDTLSTIFVPTLTTLVMLPLGLCVLAPAGGYIGDALAIVLNAFAEHGGFVAVAVIAALWEYLVMSGMHVVLLMPAMTIIMSGGNDPVFMTAGHIATWAAVGMALGTFLRMKNKEEKATALGFFISGLVGGVTEPVLYGIGFKYKKPFIGMSIGAAVGGAYAGLTHVSSYLTAASNFLGVLRYSGSTPANLTNGIIACVAAMIVSAICVYLMGYSKQEIMTGCPDE